MEILLIIISAVFVNNVVLAQFLGICPFLGVSNKLSTATGMSAAVCFVITLATLVTFLLNNYVLHPLELEFLQTISFILVIAALVQMVEIVLKKVSPSLYQALGIFLRQSCPYDGSRRGNALRVRHRSGLRSGNGTLRWYARAAGYQQCS